MPGRRNSMCKGPVVEESTVNMKDSNKALGAGVERAGRTWRKRRMER